MPCTGPFFVVVSQSKGYQIRGWDFAICALEFGSAFPQAGITEIKVEMYGQMNWRSGGTWLDIPADSGQREGFIVRREIISADPNLNGRFEMPVDLSAVNRANSGDADENHVYDWFRFRIRMTQQGGSGVQLSGLNLQLYFAGKNSAQDLSV
jgi:hypothetical protein